MIAEDVFAAVPVLTGTHATFSRTSVDAWLAGRAHAADRADWAAVRLSDGAFLGEAVVFQLDAPNESAVFRIGLAGPHVYGHGYGTEMTRLVVDHVLDVVGLHRLELEVYDHNPRARRVYEKCGFRVEGRRRGRAAAGRRPARRRPQVGAGTDPR